MKTNIFTEIKEIRRNEKDSAGLRMKK
jgi:hypothetical protein